VEIFGMNTVEEVQQAIQQLSGDGREAVANWIRDLLGEEARVAEPAVAYGVRPGPGRMTIGEYLDFEEQSPTKHEYIDGEIFTMSGARLGHGAIVMNLSMAFASHLRGSTCQPFASEIKARLKADQKDILYYPDLMVVCGSLDMDARDVTNARLVVEVLSPSTRRIDKHEKAINYRYMTSLEEYVLIEQKRPEVIIQRRSDQWTPQVLGALDEVAEFRSINLSLALRRIYEGLF
jgi:Uma2 family endonuclease